MPRHTLTCSTAFDSARAAKAARDDGIVQCGCGFPLLVRGGDEIVIVVQNLVVSVVVGVVQIVLVRRCAPCLKSIVVIVLPPFHAIDHG